MPNSFYVPAGDARFGSTELTRGPWDQTTQHGGPPAALLGRALERHEPSVDAQLVRVTYEILRPVPIAPLDVTVTTLRGGRSIQLLGGALHACGREVMRATAWRVRKAEVGVSAGPYPSQAPSRPGEGRRAPFFPSGADVGYHSGMEWRFCEGAFLEPGPATVWLRMRRPLVADEEPSQLVRVLVAADSGNGVSGAVDFRHYVFINPDLTVYLHRAAEGEWVCLEARTTIEPHGIGMAESVLHDEHGPFGRGLQSLFVAPR